MATRISVIIATFNRPVLLATLLRDLSRQTLPHSEYEVVVVDDGSKTPVEPFLKAQVWPEGFSLKVMRQKNAGQAAARHRAIEASSGDILVITDDDMRVDETFLAKHLEAHDAGAEVVLGAILPAPHVERMPIFERYHAYQLARYVERVRRQETAVRGVHVCTGNVSVRRQAYDAVGGFDAKRARSTNEDRELGIALEKHGARLAFSEEAAVYHHSDHDSLKTWLHRCWTYGKTDAGIADKHPDMVIADPWSFFHLLHPALRPLCWLAAVAPAVAYPLMWAAMGLSIGVDRLGLEKVAMHGTTSAFALQYFRGVRAHAGSAVQALRGFRTYLRKRPA